MNPYDRLAFLDASKHIAQDPELGPRIEDLDGGDWQVRIRDPEKKFAAENLSDDCIDAARLAKNNFDSGYPGWEIYSRINRGDRVFDRRIAAWAIMLARLLSRATKTSGRRNVAFVRKSARRNSWIAQCGIDAVEFVIAGAYSYSPSAAAMNASVDNELYQRLRSALTVCMVDGFENYCGELHYQLSTIERYNRTKLFLR